MKRFPAPERERRGRGAHFFFTQYRDGGTPERERRGRGIGAQQM